MSDACHENITKVCYMPSKMTDAETDQWENQQFETSVNHFKGILENIPTEIADMKGKIKNNKPLQDSSS